MKHYSPAKGILFLCLAVLLSACNFPMLNPVEPNPGSFYTQAAETAIANATLLAEPRPTITFVLTPQPTPSQTPLPNSPTATPTEIVARTPAASNTPELGGTSVPSDCDQAKFVDDITVPDDTRFAPDETFTKTWRLRNEGTCSWTPEYSLVFDDGDRMGGPAEVQLTDQNIAPGETVDISLNLVAPSDTGVYQGDYKLRNASGQIFGLGEDRDKTFWVRIQVGVPSGISFDLIARASSADWFAERGGNQVPLNFGENPDAADGFAGIGEDVMQEDGRRSAKILVTYPPAEGGVVFGEYTPYRVQIGDRFLGRIGFLADSDGDCGPGEVVFRLSVLSSDRVQELAEWRKTCDERLLPVELDLSDLRGDTIQFLLSVDSAGSSTGDYAFWSSIRIER